MKYKIILLTIIIVLSCIALISCETNTDTSNMNTFIINNNNTRRIIFGY